MGDLPFFPPSNHLAKEGILRKSCSFSIYVTAYHTTACIDKIGVCFQRSGELNDFVPRESATDTGIIYIIPRQCSC